MNRVKNVSMSTNILTTLNQLSSVRHKLDDESEFSKPEEKSENE